MVDTKVSLLTVTSFVMGVVMAISLMTASPWLLVPLVILGLMLGVLLVQISSKDSWKD